MRKSKFIMSQQKIAQVLSSIAESENLYATVEYCLQGFDFDLELRLATLKNEGECELIIPANSKTAVALVFCLLSQFDLGKSDFTEFLTKYYSQLDILTAYEVFCETIILPFQKSFFDIVKKIEETS